MKHNILFVLGLTLVGASCSVNRFQPRQEPVQQSNNAEFKEEPLKTSPKILAGIATPMVEETEGPQTTGATSSGGGDSVVAQTVSTRTGSPVPLWTESPSPLPTVVGTTPPVRETATATPSPKPTAALDLTPIPRALISFFDLQTLLAHISQGNMSMVGNHYKKRVHGSASKMLSYHLNHADGAQGHFWSQNATPRGNEGLVQIYANGPYYVSKTNSSQAYKRIAVAAVFQNDSHLVFDVDRDVFQSQYLCSDETYRYFDIAPLSELTNRLQENLTQDPLAGEVSFVETVRHWLRTKDVEGTAPNSVSCEAQ